MLKKNPPLPVPDTVVLIPPAAAPVSLVTLAAELDEPTDRLMKRLGDEVFIEPQSGLRCVSVEVCRRVIDEFDAKAAAALEVARRRRDEWKAAPRRPRRRGLPHGLSIFDSEVQ